MIKAVIFDLGGVIINLDHNKTISALKELGFSKPIDESIFPFLEKFETGKINDSEFRAVLRSFLDGNPGDEQIDKAWNAMILDIPEDRLVALHLLRQKVKLALLSNTNNIHMTAVRDLEMSEYNEKVLENTFDHVYLSHEIKLRKPYKEVYEFVLNDMNLKADEVIFIDDNKENLKGAESLGIKTIWAEKPFDFEMFREIECLRSISESA